MSIACGLHYCINVMQLLLDMAQHTPSNIIGNEDSPSEDRIHGDDDDYKLTIVMDMRGKTRPAFGY